VSLQVASREPGRATESSNSREVSHDERSRANVSPKEQITEETRVGALGGDVGVRARSRPQKEVEVHCRARANIRRDAKLTRNTVFLLLSTTFRSPFTKRSYSPSFRLRKWLYDDLILYETAAATDTVHPSPFPAFFLGRRRLSSRP
jgi:hypothetical protein